MELLRHLSRAHNDDLGRGRGQMHCRHTVGAGEYSVAASHRGQKLQCSARPYRDKRRRACKSAAGKATMAAAGLPAGVGES